VLPDESTGHYEFVLVAGTKAKTMITARWLALFAIAAGEGEQPY
jgi:hypothetical protein